MSAGQANSGQNIVFVHCDSMDGRVMGCMGHPAVQGATPNFDALAARGVLFRNTYTNNPICCPSRASMWSGRFTHNCGGWNNFKGLDPDEPTCHTRLRDAGYRLQSFGKTDYVSGSHTIRARVTPWTRAAGIARPAYRMEGPEVIEDRRERVNEHDWGNVDRAVDWLGNEAAGSDDPFFLYLGINQPHPRFRTSRLYLDRIAPDSVGLPAPDERRHPVFELMAIQENWMHGLDEETVRRVRRIYFAMVAEVDAMLGRVLEAVQKSGVGDSTWIIFSSDHGEMNMEHGQFYKMTHYETSARVPLIIVGPEARAGGEVEELTSLVDIYPTLMDIAGLEHPPDLDGYSLMPDLAGQQGARPERVLAEFHGTTSCTGAFMLRQGPWKYIAYPGFRPQLFNLDEDPDEVDDLADSLPHVVANLDDALREMVDYEAVDARVKAYDRESFYHWRRGQLDAGTYRDTMARVYSGFDRLPDEEVEPWTDEDEARIEHWLRGAEPWTEKT